MRKALIAIVAALLCAGIAGSQTNPTIKVDVDLVLVNATVTDSEGRYVTGLNKDQFDIYEDKVQQKIQYFSLEDAPVSVGIILDVSGSMRENLAISHDAALTFLHQGNKQDEYFLVEFNDRPHVTIDFTSDITQFENHLLFVPAKGWTALYDGLYQGLSKVKEGSNPKKALLLITDGGENNSRYTLGNVKDFAREKDVSLYILGLGGLGSGGDSLSSLAEMTGGRSFGVNRLDLEDACTKIAVELKNQYMIGYQPTNSAKDGKLRKIQVRVKTPPGLSTLSVRAKSGYYASAIESKPKP